MANYSTGIGAAAISAFRPNDNGAFGLGAQAVAARSGERASYFTASQQAASNALGYGASLVQSAGNTMASMANTKNTNDTRRDLYEMEFDYLRENRDLERKDRKTGLLVSGAAGVADFFLNKPRKTERAELPQFQMPEIPSWVTGGS